MPYFLTSYAMGGRTYGEYIEADDRAHAQVLAVARGLGEKIEFEAEAMMVPNRLAAQIRDKAWVEAAHSATQLCAIGVASGALTVRETFADAGLVHQLLHLALGVAGDTDKEVKAAERQVRVLARELEYRVPGWPRSFTGQPGVTVRIRDKIDCNATEGYADA